MAGRRQRNDSGRTWNPVTGCTRVSPACMNCYAEVLAERLREMGVPGYRHGFSLTLHPDRLSQPAQRRKPTFYFANSMSDLFHDDVPDAFLDDVFSVMHHTPQHTYMVLTKRAFRLPAYFAARPCPDNLWLGVTVENREHGLPRMDFLRQVKVKTRIVNMEPLLEDPGVIDFSGIHWVSAGGETGKNARPTKKEWVIRVRDQAVAAGVPFYFRRWGEWGADGIRRDKYANGRLLEGRTWDETPSRKEGVPGMDGDEGALIQKDDAQGQFSLDF